MAAICTRIWCVRPVSSEHSRKVRVGEGFEDAEWVTAGLPPRFSGTIAILMRCTDGGRSGVDRPFVRIDAGARAR
jgi:hypothetical protein